MNGVTIAAIVLILFAIVFSAVYIIFKVGVKEWLKWAVATAESLLGGETGQLKLRYVYDMAVERFPALKWIVPFKVFAAWVDEALAWLNEQVQNNPAIKAYVQPITKGLDNQYSRLVIK